MKTNKFSIVAGAALLASVVTANAQQVLKVGTGVAPWGFQGAGNMPQGY
jgi:hypothetical protein